MKVKKFNAVDNHDAMQQVRQELGMDAIILHQRKIKPKGLFGFMKKPLIEVVAAVEDQIQPAKQNLEKVERRIEANLRAKTGKQAEGNVPNQVISKEILEIKTMLSTVAQKVNQDQLPDELKKLNNRDLESIYVQLKQQEIEQPIIEKLLKELGDFVQEYEDVPLTKEMLYGKFTSMVASCVDTGLNDRPARIIFFVGPTGVGKTTTIAKLAAQFSIHEGKQVGFISADTYRIAAVEQLKTYSDILDIPIEVIYEPKEIGSAIEKLIDKDVILVDTAGRSHRNEKQMKELKLLLDQVEEKEIYLVISCTSKNQDIQEILGNYHFLENYKFIFTKLDEATTYGTILNTTIHTQKPVSYVTIGQSVPDDIEAVSSARVISLLMKEESP